MKQRDREGENRMVERGVLNVLHYYIQFGTVEQAEHASCILDAIRDADIIPYTIERHVSEFWSSSRQARVRELVRRHASGE